MTTDKPPTSEEIVRRHLNRDDLALGVGVYWAEFGEAIKVALDALAEKPALLARIAELEGKLVGAISAFAERSQAASELGREVLVLSGVRHAAAHRVAELEAVLRWFVCEFPCPEIHASIDNHPGRCPEDSDDPNEWCASARFQRALAGPPKVETL